MATTASYVGWSLAHSCSTPMTPLLFLPVSSSLSPTSPCWRENLSRRERTVICFDGDAASLMHMGCFAINASLNLPNFLHIVLNNGVHESVGGQTSVGHKADYTGIARAAGYKTGPAAVTNEADLKAAVIERLAAGGPAFIDMRIRKGMRADLPKLIITPVDVKKQLMSELG